MTLLSKLLHREPEIYQGICRGVRLSVIVVALWALVGLFALLRWLFENSGVFIFGAIMLILCFLIGWAIYSVKEYRSNRRKWLKWKSKTLKISGVYSGLGIKSPNIIFHFQKTREKIMSKNLAGSKFRSNFALENRSLFSGFGFQVDKFGCLRPL